jgi:hypothetical protein
MPLDSSVGTGKWLEEGIRLDRPAFRLSNKVSHDKEDHQLLLTVTKKPPMSSKN